MDSARESSGRLRHHELMKVAGGVERLGGLGAQRQWVGFALPGARLRRGRSRFRPKTRTLRPRRGESEGGSLRSYAALGCAAAAPASGLRHGPSGRGAGESEGGRLRSTHAFGCAAAAPASGLRHGLCGRGAASSTRRWCFVAFPRQAGGEHGRLTLGAYEPGRESDRGCFRTTNCCTPPLRFAQREVVAREADCPTLQPPLPRLALEEYGRRH